MEDVASELGIPGNTTSSAVTSLPRVASIATMASRFETFQKVLPVIHEQVQHTFVYLDGYASAPNFLRDFQRISVHRAEEVGDLHCSSRFLCLKELASPSVVVIFDDDIIYPPNYVERLVEALDRFDGHALVGVHGHYFVPPHQSYVAHRMCRHFRDALEDCEQVDEVGAGTCAFVSDRLDVDPFSWARNDMDDLNMSIEAQKRGMPRVVVSRPKAWLTPYAVNQPDSLWAKTQRDDSEQTRLMNAMLSFSGRTSAAG